MSITEETLEHTSSREGLAKTDASVTLSKELGGSFTLDEYATDQLKAYLSASLAETAEAGATYTGTQVTVNFVAATGAGRWYELKVAATGKRIRNLSAVTVNDSGSTTQYTIDTDYKLDLALGLLFVVAGGAIDVAGDDTLEIDCTEASGTKQEIQMLNETTVRAAILFIGENASTGEKFELRLHRAKITAEGDQGWVSNEYGTMDFNFIAEETTESAFSNSKVGTITFSPTS